MSKRKRIIALQTQVKGLEREIERLKGELIVKALSQRGQGPRWTPYAFCTQCFSSDEMDDPNAVLPKGFCDQCGNGGPMMELPFWALEGIQRNASNQGRAMWPNEYDKQDDQQRLDLHELVGDDVSKWPGRTVEVDKPFDRAAMGMPSIGDDPGSIPFRVTQILADGRTTYTTVRARNKNQALRKMFGSRGFPYVAAHRLPATKETK